MASILTLPVKRDASLYQCSDFVVDEDTLSAVCAAAGGDHGPSAATGISSVAEAPASKHEGTRAGKDRKRGGVLGSLLSRKSKRNSAKPAKDNPDKSIGRAMQPQASLDVEAFLALASSMGDMPTPSIAENQRLDAESGRDAVVSQDEPQQRSTTSSPTDFSQDCTSRGTEKQALTVVETVSPDLANETERPDGVNTAAQPVHVGAVDISKAAPGSTKATAPMNPADSQQFAPSKVDVSAFLAMASEIEATRSGGKAQNATGVEAKMAGKPLKLPDSADPLPGTPMPAHRPVSEHPGETPDGVMEIHRAVAAEATVQRKLAPGMGPEGVTPPAKRHSWGRKAKAKAASPSITVPTSTSHFQAGSMLLSDAARISIMSKVRDEGMSVDDAVAEALAAEAELA